MDIAIKKLEMYNKVDTVLCSYHQDWNSIGGFGSVFALFATKVARLEMVVANVTMCSEQAVRSLIAEIDRLLHSHLDRLAGLFSPLNHQFSLAYQRVRNHYQV